MSEEQAPDPEITPHDHTEFFNTELKHRLEEIKALCDEAGYPFFFAGTNKVEPQARGLFSTDRWVMQGNLKSPEHTELLLCAVAVETGDPTVIGYNITEFLRQFEKPREGMLYSLQKAGIIPAPEGISSPRIH